MEKKLCRATVFLHFLIAVFFFGASAAAQTQTVKLTLGEPVESEIKGGESRLFSVSLASGQTARVEIIQKGVDVSLIGIDPQGERYITASSPSGRFGNDLILVTARTAGEYLVEVSPADPRSPLGGFEILLREIRPTVPEDWRIGEIGAELESLAEAATMDKYKGTIQGKRDSLAKWDKVIGLSKVKKDRVWEGVALVSKGLVYEQLGELQNALDVYLESLDIWREMGLREYEGSAVNNAGVVYSDLGEYEKSITYYQQAIKIQRELGNLNSVSIYLNNLGFTHMSLGNYKKAEDLFRQSLEIKRADESPRNQRSISHTLNNLGNALFFQGKAKEGIAYLEESLELRQKLEFRWGIANSLLNLGKLRWRNGDHEEALRNLSEANIRSGELGDRRMEAESFYLLAVAEKERGDQENAIKYITAGLELIEQIRGELVASQNRSGYFSTVQNYYELYTDLLITRFEKTKDKRDVELALETSERSRSRSLLELLREARVNFRRGNDPHLLEKLKELQSELNEKYTDRQNLLGGNPEAEKVAGINDQIIDLNLQIQNLQTRIRRENPKYADLTEGKTLTIGEIRNLLDERTVLLEYKLGGERSFVWLITTDSIDVFNLPPGREIEARVKTFNDLIIAGKRPDEAKVRELSLELGQTLMGEFAARLSGKRLAVVADGILQYTPFSALAIPGSEKVLADENEVVILPSASVLGQLRDGPKPARINQKTIAIFADPVFDPADPRVGSSKKTVSSAQSEVIERVLRDFQFGDRLPRLLASRREANNIAALTAADKTSLRTDFQASLENVENADLSGYRIIHFATHGLLNTSQPGLSGLVFSLYDEKGRPQDGFLSLDDIYNLNLQSELVVLSACQTALGKEVRGEGLIGVSRGFLYAGSERIIASLWKVDDFATAEFMRLFYRYHLEKELPAPTALRRAKADMKKIPRYRSPYYWSAFILLGDWK
ncbi:MAG: CHAT domain-containing tetratricopeptide repeat protein [Pyrinomonadaceae bacterium]